MSRIARGASSHRCLESPSKMRLFWRRPSLSSAHGLLNGGRDVKARSPMRRSRVDSSIRHVDRPRMGDVPSYTKCRGGYETEGRPRALIQHTRGLHRHVG